MSDDPQPHIAEDFQMLVLNAQRGEMDELEKAWIEERAAAKKLREANQHGLTATDLLGIKTEQELLAEHDHRLTVEDAAAAKAAADKMEDTSEREHHPFPAPSITYK